VAYNLACSYTVAYGYDVPTNAWEPQNMDKMVRARIDAKTKERAAFALGKMGMSISEAIRLLLMRVAKEQRLPFNVKVPKSAARKGNTGTARTITHRSGKKT